MLTRLAVRHRLAREALVDDPVAIARSLVGLHGTDAASLYLSAALRMRRPSLAAVEAALYEQRQLVRILGMRRTMFGLPLDLVPVVQASCANALLAGERKKLVGYLEASGVAPPGGGSDWLAAVSEATLTALEARGEALATELSADVPDLARSMLLGQGTSSEGTVGVSTRVLFLLATEGRIVRGRSRGTWVSSQHRWVPLERWIPGGIPSIPLAEARVELVRRYLASYGPASTADVKWWTGWTLGEARKAIAAAGAVEGPEGWLLADDLAPLPEPAPWVALLPALDPTAMGWTDRSRFLDPELRPPLFDRSGNIGPTVWANGRIVGGWAHSGVRVVHRLLTDPGAEARAAIEARAAEVEALLGPVRVTPRFRTPLEKELAAT